MGVEARSVLMDGTVLRGGYEVEYLDAGGMSVTYLARRGSERFLVKEVASTSAECVAALEHEYHMLCRLDHPGIVRAHAFFQQEGHCYLVVDYIDGETLDRRAAARPPGEMEVTGWALQLCDILDYLHRCEPPVIHRDIKPLNIMVDGEGRLHLLDFGISRTWDALRLRDTAAMGSAMFAAPEQFGQSQTDARSDIFSLGATLHHLLCGDREDARQGFSFAQLRAIRPDLSPRLEAVLQRAVEMRPDHRWDCAAAMRAALRQTASHPAARRASRAVSRERVLAGVSCGLLGIFLFCNRIASTPLEAQDVLVHRRPAAVEMAAQVSTTGTSSVTPESAAPAPSVTATPPVPSVTGSPTASAAPTPSPKAARPAVPASPTAMQSATTAKTSSPPAPRQVAPQHRPAPAEGEPMLSDVEHDGFAPDFDAPLHPPDGPEDRTAPLRPDDRSGPLHPPYGPDDRPHEGRPRDMAVGPDDWRHESPGPQDGDGDLQNRWPKAPAAPGARAGFPSNDRAGTQNAAGRLDGGQPAGPAPDPEGRDRKW